jgi:hypothetical protein
MPARIVSATEPTTSATVPQPSAVTWAMVIRNPRSATPTRRITLEANWMPGMQRPSSARKLSAMPSRSAKSIALALYCSESDVAAMPTTSATARPGASRRNSSWTFNRPSRSRP